MLFLHKFQHFLPLFWLEKASKSTKRTIKWLFTAVLRDTRPPQAKSLRAIVVFDIQGVTTTPLKELKLLQNME
jgi:hypothetical protein